MIGRGSRAGTGVDGIDAVARFLRWAGEGGRDLPFIRMLGPVEQDVAREYLLGLAEHTARRRSVPAPALPPREEPEK